MSIDGPNVLLPPKYALTVALLVHELATNSAKYGSLSIPDGRVALRSNMSGEVLRLEWREAGGPPVTPPTTRGFGLRLVSLALEQFGGGTEMVFEPSGLVCRMHLKLPADARPNPLGHDGDQTLPAVKTEPEAQHQIGVWRGTFWSLAVGGTEPSSPASRWIAGLSRIGELT